MANVEEFLKLKGIEYVLHEHPAVYTCEEAERFCGDIPGLSCKNLLLKSKKSSRYFLIILPAAKRADLKEIGETVGEKHITFANPEDLQTKLGLKAGAVSLFGLLNDKNHEVDVFVDRDVYYAEVVSFHPNRNTPSLELSGAMFRKFLQVIENRVKQSDL